MFDIGASELLLVVIVAIVVIGPKDLPLALRTAGRWIGKIRRVSGHFRAGIETMIREAELEEMERKWREHNAAILTGAQEMEPSSETPPASSHAGDAVAGAPALATAEPLPGTLLGEPAQPPSPVHPSPVHPPA